MEWIPYSDEDLVSHISKRQRIGQASEFDIFLKIDRAQALSDTLSWWKVSLLFKIFFNLKLKRWLINIINYIFIYSDIVKNFQI